jgi:hypothetical protein
MADAPKGISKPKLLIGEGWEEVRFFGALLNHLNLSDIQVEEYGGKNNLQRYLKTLPNRGGYRQLVSLGVTRDADDDATNAFRSVCGALGSVGLAAPDAPGQFAGGNPRTGVFILPDGQTLGCWKMYALLQSRRIQRYVAWTSISNALMRQRSGYPATWPRRAYMPGWHRRLSLTNGWEMQRKLVTGRGLNRRLTNSNNFCVACEQQECRPCTSLT